MQILIGKWMLASVVLVAASGAALAQTTVQEQPPVAVTSTGGSTQVESRLVNSFSSFAGSDENARSLVTGLRQGSAITLSPTGGEGPVSGESVTFTPATRPMGYGNVRIALALAQEQLAQNGVTQPTPDQIRAALAGGTIASGTGEPGTTARLAGVLQMRADGMGWGQIANSMGVKLGAVMSGRTSTQAAFQSSSASTNATSTRGVGTGTGTATASGAINGRGNGVSAQSGLRPGTGIVTATGSSATGASAGVRAYGGGGSSGGVATAAGAAARGGNGQALAKGHVRN